MTVGNSNSFESIGLHVILFLNLAHGQMLKQNYANLNWRPLPFSFNFCFFNLFQSMVVQNVHLYELEFFSYHREHFLCAHVVNDVSIIEPSSALNHE